MRKISGIIKLKDELIKYSDTTKLLAEGEAMNKLLSTVDSYEIQAVGKLVDHGTMQLAGRVSQAVNDIVVALDLEIAALVPSFLNRTVDTCYQFFDANRKNSRLTVPDTIQEILHGRIRLYIDWHYPGLEIGPVDGLLTPHLVGCDPLYLADASQDHLDVSVAQFPEEYVNRVRSYLVDYSKENQTLLQLPSEQFGFIFSWNYFNYLPFAIISRYLQDAYALLAPGGVFMFGFNDASMVNGAKHAEFSGMSYVTQKLLIDAATNIGYEILSTTHRFDCGWHNISWLEIKKPGVLSTIKAHQTMGIIKDIG